MTGHKTVAELAWLDAMPYLPLAVNTPVRSTDGCWAGVIVRHVLGDDPEVYDKTADCAQPQDASFLRVDLGVDQGFAYALRFYFQKRVADLWHVAWEEKELWGVWVRHTMGLSTPTDRLFLANLLREVMA